MALQYEEAGDWDRALEVYRDVVENGNEMLWKRMAVKQTLKAGELSGRGFADLRNIIGEEIASAGSWYKPFLDFILCEILIKEGKYQEAIGELQRKAGIYKGAPMEIEMLARIANVYGDYLKDEAKAREYADRAAALDPGNDLLESAYASAGIEYNPMLFKESKSDDDGAFDDKTAEQPTEPSADESVDAEGGEYVSVAPSPANPITTITYSIRNPSNVRLTLYSITGQRVATLVDGPMSAGAHAATFDGSRYASGVYFYRFESPGLNKTGKFLLLK